MLTVLSPALRRNTISLIQAGLCRWNSALVVCDPLSSHGIPSASTQSVVTAASQLHLDTVTMLVVGGDAPVTHSLSGVTKVAHVPYKALTVDSIKDAIEDAIVRENCTHVLSCTSMTLIPEAAKQLGTPIAEDVVEITGQDIFLAGDMKNEIQLKDTLKMLTVRTSRFEPAELLEVAPEVEVWKEQSMISKLAYKAAPPTLLLLVAVYFIPMDY